MITLVSPRRRIEERGLKDTQVTCPELKTSRVSKTERLRVSNPLEKKFNMPRGQENKQSLGGNFERTSPYISHSLALPSIIAHN